MPSINQVICVGSVGNTGVPLCPLDPGFISGSIIVPKGTEIDVTSLQSNLAALLYNASPTARGYAIYDFEKITDASDKLQLQSMPTGAKHPVREGYNDHTFQYFDGALSVHKNLRKFNGSEWDFYYVDTNQRNGTNTIWGIIGSTASKLRAYPTNPGGFFWAHPITPNTGTERTAYMLQFSFLQKYNNDLAACVAAGFDLPTTLPSLNDAILTASATVNGTSGKFNVTITSPTGVDIGALNSAAWASASLWNCKLASSGATIAISGAPVWTPSTTPGVPGYFVVTVVTTSPYPTPPAPVLINLAVPATLVAAGLDYESTGALSIASN